MSQSEKSLNIINYFLLLTFLILIFSHFSTVTYTKPFASPYRFDRTKQCEDNYQGRIFLVYQFLMDSIEKHYDNFCLGQREKLQDGKLSEYKWITYGQMWNTSQSIGTALHALGCFRNDRIGVMSITCPEYFMVDVVCHTYGLCSVPLYVTLGPEAVPFIINYSNCRIVFTSVENFAVIRLAARVCPNIKAIIVYGQNADQFCAQFEQGDYTPLLPRIPEDDHNYFIETYDPTNPDTYKNGLDQPPDRKQQFIQFTTFNGKTSKQLEQEELQEINEPEVGDGDQNNTEKQKLNSFHKQKFNFRVYSWNYLRSFGEKIRKIESNDKLKQQEEEQEQQDYLKQDEQQQQPNQPFSLQPYTECINHWKSLSNPVIPTQDSILTIIFTSGTTGTPKGVILKHRNLISTIQAGLSFGMNIFHEDSSYYAYLPLAHVFEFIIEFAVMTIGGKIGYSSGDTKEIINEVAVLKPELFVGVPRVLNKIYEAFQNAIQQVAQKSRIMKFVFNSALKRKLKIQEEWQMNHNKKARLLQAEIRQSEKEMKIQDKQQQNRMKAKKVDNNNNNNLLSISERINLIDAGTKPRTPLYDKYVFNKFAEKLGGNIYFIMCGSAPLSPQVHKFLQATISLPISCGFSMSETTCSGSIPFYPDYSSMGTCGPIMNSVEMKLRSVPEMGYYVNENAGSEQQDKYDIIEDELILGLRKPNQKDQQIKKAQMQGSGKGEILFRGPAVFHGYYRDPWQSREAFDDGDMNDSIPQPDETEEQKFQREKRYKQNLGWFRTGDVGYMDSNGNLVIIDRVKDIFKLAQGEYVAPDVVEQLYGRCPYILHSFMYGESSWRYAIAIVVPNEASIMNKIMNETQQNDSQRKFSIGNKKQWIEEIRKEKNEQNRQEKQINTEIKEKSATNDEIEVTLSDLLPKHESEIKQFILYEMNEVAKSQGGLSSFQLAADILLLTDQMGSIQAQKIIDSSNRPKLLQAFPDECITPSLKLKRFMVAKMYQNDLHECYERVVARREGRL